MKIVVLGGGESGVGAAYLAKKKGLNVFLSDKGLIKDQYKKLLTDSEIEFEEGSHDETRILDADWIIKSPGIPKKTDIIFKILQKGIRLSSEIEFAAEFTQAKIIAINTIGVPNSDVPNFLLNENIIKINPKLIISFRNESHGFNFKKSPKHPQSVTLLK